MDLNGQAVRHKAFGCGVVAASAADVIIVRFPEGEKRFLYPDAFQEHLELENGKMQRRILAEIAGRDEEKQRQRRQEQQEQERRQRLLHFTIAANSHAVFHISPEERAAVRQTGVISTGRYRSGASKGMPRMAARLKPNSACLLTERPAGRPETERRIVGVLMVRSDFFGEDCPDGRIEGHGEHRLLLEAEETMPFWPHFGSGATPRWGNIPFKYCSGAAMHHVLYELVEHLEDAERKAAAVALYRYFCAVNRLRPAIDKVLPEIE